MGAIQAFGDAVGPAVTESGVRMCSGRRSAGILTLAGLVVWSAAMSFEPSAFADNGDAASAEARKPRRIIVNRDAGLPTQWDKGRDDYVQRNFPALEKTQADTVFWCFDEGTTAGHESDVRELQRYWKTSETAAGLARAVAEGNDPPKVAIEEARKRGLEIFYSFRINGHEDSYIPAEVPQFKKDHPEYTLKGHVPDEVWAALDFAIPEVRRQRLDVIREVLEKYDFDGIEIDWMRSPYYFRPHQEYRLRYILTDMMREFRRMVDARSKELDRRLLLAVRVGETIEASLLDGFDVETWAREGLMDVLSLGSGATYCDVEGFRRITKGTGVQIYPCIYPYGPFYAHPYPAEIVRGIAANYWAQKPDGMYTFNWTSGPNPLMNEVGSPETLAGKDKLFIAYIGMPGEPLAYYPHNWRLTPLPAELWPVTAETPLVIPLDVADDVAAAGREGKLGELRLRVAFEGATADDALAVSLNGTALAGTLEAGKPADTKLDFEGARLVVSPEPSLVRQGRNEVGVRLVNRAADGEKPIVVHAVDLLVRYR